MHDSWDKEPSNFLVCCSCYRHQHGERQEELDLLLDASCSIHILRIDDHLLAGVEQHGEDIELKSLADATRLRRRVPRAAAGRSPGGWAERPRHAGGSANEG